MITVLFTIKAWERSSPSVPVTLKFLSNGHVEWESGYVGKWMWNPDEESVVVWFLGRLEFHIEGLHEAFKHSIANAVVT